MKSKRNPALPASACSAKCERTLIIAVETLKLYADPESYHAIALFSDPPSGWFADDVSKVDHPHYDRKMPGKEARLALQKIRRLISSNDKAEPCGTKSL